MAGGAAKVVPGTCRAGEISFMAFIREVMGVRAQLAAGAYISFAPIGQLSSRLVSEMISHQEAMAWLPF
jgi:hypothetical protein